jgi:hypothetical protein
LLKIDWLKISQIVGCPKLFSLFIIRSLFLIFVNFNFAIMSSKATKITKKNKTVISWKDDDKDVEDLVSGVRNKLNWGVEGVDWEWETVDEARISSFLMLTCETVPGVYHRLSKQTRRQHIQTTHEAGHQEQPTSVSHLLEQILFP